MDQIPKVKEAVLQNKPSKELLAFVTKSMQDKLTNWSEAYWLCKYLYAFENNEGKYDKEILDGLKWCFENGLTYDKDLGIFLDGLQMLAQTAFKYNLFIEVNNCLLMLDSYSEPSELPKWFYNYRAKIYYKLNIESIVHPEKIIDYLTKSGDLTEKNNFQGIAVLKDFIITMSENIDQLRRDGLLNAETLLKLEGVLRPFLVNISSEWNQFLERIVSYAEDREDSEMAKILLQINAFNSILLQKDKEYEDLYQKYLELENQYQELLYEQKISSIRGEPVEKNNAYIRKILILGATEIKPKEIYGIAKTKGLSKDQIEIRSDYDKNKRFSIDNLRIPCPYDGILIGPIAHKVLDINDYNSVIERLKNEEGFPCFQELRTKSGELKITKTSFKEGLDTLITKIKSNKPD